MKMKVPILFLFLAVGAKATTIFVPQAVNTTNYSIKTLGGQPFNPPIRADDLLFVTTGDSQYWFKCTSTNTACLRATSCDRSNSTCRRAESEWANRAQRVSITALMRSLVNKPKSLIVNGDLTDYGHAWELEKYEREWPGKIGDVRIYPGLGNHDYANNVDDCAFNHCAHRMLEFYQSYVEKTLRRPMHVAAKETGNWYRQWVGSLAYSWDDCATVPTSSGISERKNCVHFVQLNNYPTYSRDFDFLGGSTKWHVRPSLAWLADDLNSTSLPVVVNFHDFDTHFKPEDKVHLRRILKNSGRTILGIYFAHFHSAIGLHSMEPYWCLNGHATPLFYSGSVPNNKYMLTQVRNGQIKNAYIVHAVSQGESSVSEIPLLTSCLS